MTDTLFKFDKRNYADCQKAYRGENNQEYYLGDYCIEAGPHIDVQADRKCLGSYSIIRLRSRTKLSFSRTWTHIRDDATDVTVLWFVKHGRFVVRQQSGDIEANTGDFILTKSLSPFSAECLPDKNSFHEVLHVVIPSHVLRNYFPHGLRANFSIPSGNRALSIAENILLNVFEDTNELSDSIAKLLLENALSVVAGIIRERVDHSNAVRLSLSEQRLRDIIRHIDLHLSNPNLCRESIAAACGISPRYISYLLQRNGTPFSELVWGKRMEIAARWLASTKSPQRPISEIAFRLGFKSSSHFTRMFKRVHHKSPREYRTNTQKVMETNCRNL